MPVRFIFALHNHQPVGNFDSVFEDAFRESYQPFLELMEEYWEVPFVLHTSGPLLEWLVERQPQYIERLRRLVTRGQVEILGGGFYEPILPNIPSCDRIGQIRTYSTYLENLFQTRVRGMWIPERVWEQGLVADIAAAGIEYTVLDDYHFKQAGLQEQQLTGYYLSESQGRLLRIFPGSERMRYLIPFRNPEETLAYFGTLAGREENTVVVFADDGEKFGSWPETYKHCYQDGWLRRFLNALREARSWVRLCHLAHVVDELPQAGTIYLPDCSYREMTEWALPTPKQVAYKKLVRDLERDFRWEEIRPFLRGGYWLNFRMKYPETQEMYARMLQVSRRLQETETSLPAHVIERARQALYRAQCNCPWWHGTFGGLYLPHLRAAVYEYLIEAENLLLAAEQRPSTWIELAMDDFNLDGAPEARLSNAPMAAYICPRTGGCLYELDLRPIRRNVLATLARRPEAYHETIRQYVQGQQHNRERVILKQAGLERWLHYDAYLRKSLVDHFYEPGVQIEQLMTCQAAELGDFVTGPYKMQTHCKEDEARVVLSRQGKANGVPVRLTKEVCMSSNSGLLLIHYTVEAKPGVTPPLHFAVEFNFAGMAAGADDRYFYYENQQPAGQLQTLQEKLNTDRIGLVDEWLGLDASLVFSRRSGVWAFPIQTVSQSEGGFELVHQSTVVMPHWLLEPDATGRWEVTIQMRLDMSRAEARRSGR